MLKQEKERGVDYYMSSISDADDLRKLGIYAHQKMTMENFCKLFFNVASFLDVGVYQDRDSKYIQVNQPRNASEAEAMLFNQKAYALNTVLGGRGLVIEEGFIKFNLTELGEQVDVNNMNSLLGIQLHQNFVAMLTKDKNDTSAPQLISQLLNNDLWGKTNIQPKSEVHNKLTQLTVDKPLSSENIKPIQHRS